MIKIAGRRWTGEWNKAAQWENHQKGDGEDCLCFGVEEILGNSYETLFETLGLSKISKINIDHVWQYKGSWSRMSVLYRDISCMQDIASFGIIAILQQSEIIAIF